MTISQRLATFAANISYESLPPEVVASIKDRILDTLGICVAARDVDAARSARKIVDEWGGTGDCTCIGDSLARSPALAAMVNGTCAHALDFDDTHLPSIVHPSAMLIPAVLAQAEACGSDGRSTMAALAAGYELCTRLALAQYDPNLRSSLMFERGLHATSIIGAVAGAAACARLRGLDEHGIRHALAIACSLGAGLLEANRSGGTVKKFHGGWTGHASVTAASAAAHGLTGPDTVFEGRFGFFRAYCGEGWRPESLDDSLGDRWETPGIFFKPYPCNHFTHAFVDAAMALKRRGIRPQDVDHITLGTAAPSWRTVGDPIEEKRHPRSPYHALFSAPFVFATALVGGSGLGVSQSDFSTELLNDPIRQGLAASTDIVVDDACTEVFPHQLAGVARVTLKNRTVIEERIMETRGGPNRPMSRAELAIKLDLNAGSRAKSIAAATAALERLESVRPLMASCA